MLLAKLLLALSFLGLTLAEDCSKANSLFSDELYDDALLEILVLEVLNFFRRVSFISI